MQEMEYIFSAIRPVSCHACPICLRFTMNFSNLNFSKMCLFLRGFDLTWELVHVKVKVPPTVNLEQQCRKWSTSSPQSDLCLAMLVPFVFDLL